MFHFFLSLLVFLHVTNGADKFDWESYKNKLNEDFVFKMLKHSEEIKKETEAYKASDSNVRFNQYWDVIHKTQDKTAYIFGGVGSTTTQLFTIYNDNPNAHKEDSVEPILDVGDNFGAKTSLSDDDLELNAKALLKKIVDERKDFFEDTKNIPDAKEVAVILGKTIAWGLVAVKPKKHLFPLGRCIKDWVFQDKEGKLYKLWPLLGAEMVDDDIDISDGRNKNPAKAIKALRSAANELNNGDDKYKGQFEEFYIKPPCGPKLDMAFGDNMAMKLVNGIIIASPGPQGYGDIGGGSGRALITPELKNHKLTASENKAEGILSANELFFLAKYAKDQPIKLDKVVADKNYAEQGNGEMWIAKAYIDKLTAISGRTLGAIKPGETPSAIDAKVATSEKQYLTDLAAACVADANSVLRMKLIAEALATKFATDIIAVAPQKMQLAVDIKRNKFPDTKFPLTVFQTGEMRKAYFDNDRYRDALYAHEEYDDNILDDGTNFVVRFDTKQLEEQNNRQDDHYGLHRVRRNRIARRRVNRKFYY